jgi:hypothetical protein
VAHEKYVNNRNKNGKNEIRKSNFFFKIKKRYMARLKQRYAIEALIK